MSERPLYRDRVSRRAPEVDLSHEHVSLRRQFRAVFGTPEGMKVLDYICTTLCHVDDVAVSTDYGALIDANARRNVGLTIAALVLAPYEDAKPEVKG